MKRTTPYGTVLVALLFVGAGCTSSMRGEADLDTAPMKVEAGASVDVDAAIDAVLESTDVEAAAQAEVEKDADDAAADSAELDAMMQADYEVK